MARKLKSQNGVYVHLNDCIPRNPIRLILGLFYWTAVQVVDQGTMETKVPIQLSAEI